MAGERSHRCSPWGVSPCSLPSACPSAAEPVPHSAPRVVASTTVTHSCWVLPHSPGAGVKNSRRGWVGNG